MADDEQDVLDADQGADEELDSALRLLLGLPGAEDVVFSEYLEYVANDPLLRFKDLIHHGLKQGESLYMHIMNGIAILNQLRQPLEVSDLHARILFSAYTLHDLNKWISATEERKRYRDIATLEEISHWMSELKLDIFFEGYVEYLDVIAALMWGHSAHNVANFDVFARSRSLPHHVIDNLTRLIQAADIIDLSKTIDEQLKKQEFLHHVNAFSPRTQYALFTHRSNEQRGSFTNIVHNAVSSELQRRFDALPLLLYPEGTVYLVSRAALPTPDASLLTAIASGIAASLREKTAEGFSRFITPKPMGISVDRKCLALGLSFASLFGVINAIIQRRSYPPEKIQEMRTDAEQRAQKSYASLPAATQALVDAQREQGTIGADDETLRTGELLRSYYIFLYEHGKKLLESAPWEYIYERFEVVDTQRQLLEAFDARIDRGYVLAALLALPYSTVQQRILEDGAALFDAREQADERLPLLLDYVQQVVSFSGLTRTAADFQPATGQYTQRQHRQCVLCSLPFPTEPWSAGDVRSDIKVQVFSNRLAGAPGEPKKYVCRICHLQYLVEKLNYPEIRGEQPVYLHVQPYSFLAAPLASSLKITLSALVQSDSTTEAAVGGALHLNNMTQIMQSQVRHQVNFAGKTKKGTDHPYGLYIPRHSDTVGGMLTFPVNPAGDTATSRFVFVVEYALVLQRLLGCKILVSTSATPSLDKTSFSDVYFDFIPLSVRGLIRRNDYAEFVGTNPGPLHDLWQQLNLLYAIHQPLVTLKRNPLSELVRTLARHPLELFYTAEKLAEHRARTAAGASESGWLIAQIASHVRHLALSVGDPLMNELDPHLKQLATIAREYHLRGASFKKNSMTAALDEMLRKVSLVHDELSCDVVRAAAAQDLFDHINRVRKLAGYGAGQKVHEGCARFVHVFFDDILNGVYGGKLNRLLNHAKVLRSAYHFYIQQEYNTKPLSAKEQQSDPIIQDVE